MSDRSNVGGGAKENPIPSKQVRTHSDFLDEVYADCFPDEFPSKQVSPNPAILLADAVLAVLETHPKPEEAIAACRIAAEVLGLKIQRWPGVRINTKVNGS